MARKPRIHYPGALYHVMLRGNGGQKIFFGEKDYLHLYNLLEDGVIRFGHRIHAFCCMPNHIHLLAQVGDIPLSRIIQNLSFRYTGWINRRFKRMGHLFQGRFKALLVDEDSYLLELTRYIHLNPLRARLVEKPEHYRWSGHGAYLGHDVLSWLSTDWVLSQFSKRKGSARQRYGAFVREGLGDCHRPEFSKGTKEGRILGDDDFLEQVEKQMGSQSTKKVSLDVLIRKVCEIYNLKEWELAQPGKLRLASEARGIIAWQVRESSLGTLAELSKRFDRDLSSLSIAASKIKKRLSRDEQLSITVRDLKKTLG